MKNVHRLIIALVVMAFLLAGFSAVFAAEKKAPETVVLKGAPMGGVKFPHKAHAVDQKIKCDTCHHASKSEKPLTSAQQACTDCHTKTATPPMKTKLQAAFHNPTAQAGLCIDCHKAEIAKGKKAPAPGKCADCHKKENV
ncbi:MAG TPA: cytochrome c3 family protein [Terriglobales bacterium]|nr:cytochrome c3 family protein [Terriglobales bacterium]